MALGSLDARNTFCGSVQTTNPQKVSEAFSQAEIASSHAHESENGTLGQKNS